VRPRNKKTHPQYTPGSARTSKGQTRFQEDQAIRPLAALDEFEQAVAKLVKRDPDGYKFYSSALQRTQSS
jgi:hypothetical protein